MRVIGGWSEWRAAAAAAVRASAASVRSTATTSRSRSATRWRCSISNTSSAGATDCRLIGFFDAGRATVARSAAPTRADRAVAEGVGWGIGARRFRVDFGYKRRRIVPSSLRVVRPRSDGPSDRAHEAGRAASASSWRRAAASRGGARGQITDMRGAGVGRHGDDRAARHRSRSVQENAGRRRRAASAGAGGALGEPAGLGPAGISRDRAGASPPSRIRATRRVDHRPERRCDDLCRRRRIRCRCRSISAIASAITLAQRYYVHVIATLGTLAEREVDDVGDAVFGRPSEANGLGSLGRLMFRTVLQVSDYLQSVSAEARSRQTGRRGHPQAIEAQRGDQFIRPVSAISGSTRLARSAGTRLAAAAITTRSVATRRERRHVGRARAEQQRAQSRVPASASAMPATTPSAASRSP